jgi:hypothetical protein
MKEIRRYVSNYVVVETAIDFPRLITLTIGTRLIRLKPDISQTRDLSIYHTFHPLSQVRGPCRVERPPRQRAKTTNLFRVLVLLGA